ncbi:MAG TPA: glycosyltransferase [Candidatus Sulfotelmatobacter sp.]|nr:glycosyltransferase [Candidatus Sulfotelmatobacter sp.]
MIAGLIGALASVIWIVLVIGWGRFWRVVTLPGGLQLRSDAPRVAVIVPARNEADVIGRVISSLLAQDYPGPLRIFVVDDHSTDSTGAIVADAAKNAADRVTVVAAAPLPAGWTGKMWALAQGVERAAEFSPEYFLFSDADIVHAPGSVTSLGAMAQARSLDMVSLMVKLRCVSFAERALMPAFVFFFFMLYPPEWVNDRRKKTAAAAGGDILVRADALARIGGIGTIRGELIDDCALAREIKRGGGIWLGLTDDVESVRTYDTFSNVGRMISRNAFYQLQHSAWLLIGTLLGLGITYVAPVILLFFGGWPAILGATAWLLMSISYWPMVRFYGLSPLWAFSLPIVAVFYAGATVHSAIEYWMGRGGEWKGRAQDRAG